MLFTRKEKSYGVVPVLYEKGIRKYLVLKQKQMSWSFPKGHGIHGEDPMESARRELEEETGIFDARIQKEPTFEISYINPDFFFKMHKTVRFYIGHMHDRHVEIQESEILEYKWADYAEARELLHYDASKKLLDDVDKYLNGLIQDRG